MSSKKTITAEIPVDWQEAVRAIAEKESAATGLRVTASDIYRRSIRNLLESPEARELLEQSAEG